MLNHETRSSTRTSQPVKRLNVKHFTPCGERYQSDLAQDVTEHAYKTISGLQKEPPPSLCSKGAILAKSVKLKLSGITGGHNETNPNQEDAKRSQAATKAAEEARLTAAAERAAAEKAAAEKAAAEKAAAEKAAVEKAAADKAATEAAAEKAATEKAAAEQATAKRKATASFAQESLAAAKRSRRAIEELADEYTCPITFELPIDPVTAEDGRCYERCAIEEWLEKNPQPQVKSPVTNELMGKRLFPAVQLRNTLTRLVENGEISGPRAVAWKQAKANQAQVAALRAKAEAGDAHAMGRLGFSYRDGTRGLKKDATQAFKWFKKAADLRDPPAATSCGVAYINGSGVEPNTTRGICMVTIAATLGSEHACSVLGWANECGHHGFDKNPDEATRWYREMQKCACRDSVDVYRERATAWLREHP